MVFGPFFHLVILGTKRIQRVFQDTLVRQSAFKAHKKKKFKKSKNWNFSPWFWSKLTMG